MPWFLRKGGADYCPLCWTAVPDEEKPDTSLPSRLRLSGNHRHSIDPDVFERRMGSIPDDELWSALVPGVIRGDASGPAAAFQRHLATRPGLVRLSKLTGMSERAFLSVEEYRAELGRHPEVEVDMLRQADNVASHRFGYGQFTHQFGPRVDFNHDFGHPGMKYGWHYWHWGVPLVSAFAAGGDAKYAAAFADLFSQWYAQRDDVEDGLANLDADVIWYELGIAVRTPVFVDALVLAAGSAAWPPSAAADLLRTVLGHCRWLYECSTRNPFHAYNWPIQVAVTLGHAGTLLPELKEAASWRSQADAVIREHLRRDFLEDGGYQERTPNYTGYVLGLFASYARLLETNPPVDRELVSAIRRATERCLSVWAELTTPLGMAPAVNDTGRGTEMPRLLAAGARDFGRPDFLGPAGLAAAQAPPGFTGAHTSPGAPSSPPPGSAVGFPPRLSACFQDTGFAVMRSDWTSSARYLFFNFAPWAVHTHQDILSFECFANGAAIAVDPGLARAGYGDEDHAGWFAAARGHNMLCVEETDPARHLVDVTDVRWLSTARLDFVAATHHGYTESLGVSHRRHVVFLKPACWVIYDTAQSERPGLRLDWFFHSPLALEATPEGWHSGSGPGLTLSAADASRYERRTGSGPADLDGLPGEPPHRDIGWVSFCWLTRGNGETEEIAVLLAPGTGSASIRRVGAAGAGSGAGGARFRVEAGDRRWDVAIRADGVEAQPA